MRLRKPRATFLTSACTHSPRILPPISLTMSADLAARIEYSEKYNDDRFEYRCVRSRPVQRPAFAVRCAPRLF